MPASSHSLVSALLDKSGRHLLNAAQALTGLLAIEQMQAALNTHSEDMYKRGEGGERVLSSLFRGCTLCGMIATFCTTCRAPVLHTFPSIPSPADDMPCSQLHRAQSRVNDRPVGCDKLALKQ